MPHLSSVYSCPSDSPRAGDHVKAFHNLSYGYLSKLEVTCDPGCGSPSRWFPGRSQALVTRPADIVLVADTGGRQAFAGAATTPGSMINPPDAQPSSEYFYGPDTVGWGNYFKGTGGAKWADTGEASGHPGHP